MLDTTKLNEAQMERFKKLKKSVLKNAAIRMGKAWLCILAGNVAVIFIDALFVQNKDFVVGGMLVTFVMTIASLMRATAEENDRIKQEIDIILKM